MYGLPKDFDGDFLIGKVLEQICFNENQASFNFSDGLLMTIEGAFIHEHANSKGIEQPAEVPVSSSDAMRLLGLGILGWAVGAEGTLILMFANGHRLKCLDTSLQYESYRIEWNGRTIIV